jgi:hypothetical protein
VYTTGAYGEAQRLAIVMNLTDETTELLEGEALDLFMNP